MLIDPAIRDWVMIPLLALVIISLYVRIFAMKLLSDTKPVDKDELAQRNLVARSARLRQNGGYISYSGFKMRKDYLEDESKGKLREEVQNKSPMGPMGQMDMFKQQFVMMGTQLGLGMFTQSFTSGFVALRMPFGLTERFKSMTQAGIGVAGLETTYVSSTSWYMMTAFGLPRLMQLFTRSAGSAADEAKMMQMQMGMGMMPGMGGPGQMWQGKQAYKAELSALSTAQWAPSALLQTEKQLLEEARVIQANGGMVQGNASGSGAAAGDATTKKKQ